MSKVPATEATTRVIGVLGFDGVNAQDVVGPIEAFTSANSYAADQSQNPPYRVQLIGLDSGAFTSESSLMLMPHCTLVDAPKLDTLIVPGGSGLRVPDVNARVADWLLNNTDGIRRVATVCTGVYGLAPTGLLDGREVTTHWRFAADVASRFPKLKIDGNAIFTKDGRYYTSAGITAGIDLALALIESDLGPAAALAVARDLVVYLMRPGGQAQYSEPLRFQVRAGDRFAELAAWIAAHLDADLSVEVLAQRVCLGTRHFARRFRAEFGCTPAAYVEDLRLSEARRRLTLRGAAIERIATSVGFQSADVFRRAFERRYGLSPQNYRERFGSASSPASSRSPTRNQES